MTYQECVKNREISVIFDMTATSQLVVSITTQCGNHITLGK